MLLGWVSVRHAFGLVGLYLLTENIFLGLAFAWDFDKLVYVRTQLSNNNNARSLSSSSSAAVRTRDDDDELLL